VVELDEPNKASNKKSAGKQRPAVKKGFLNSAKAKATSLYPDGSKEGVKKKTIFDRCQVVDMNDPSTLPPDLQQQGMYVGIYLSIYLSI
jgi:hypothetical protein